MSKRDPEQLRRKRQEEVRRQLMIIGGAAVIVMLVLIFLLTRKGRTEGNAAGSAGAAAVSTATASLDAVPAPVTSEAAVPQGVTDLITDSVASVAEPPAEIVSKGYIADGVAHFVNDPAFSEKITILGTGDNIIHEALYLDAKTDDGYDFRPMYAKVKPYIQAADIATVNQETPIAMTLGGPSGYPAFNTPEEAGDALIDAGFDIFNQANNHVLDMGENGLIATLDYWDSRNMPYFGAYRSGEDLRTPRIIEKNGIKVAFLGFVNWTNKEPTGETDMRLVYVDDEESVQSCIRDAKAQADIVVVYAHWGEEGVNEITEQMSSMAQKMVNWGADVVYGNHTHLVQKITVLTRESDGALCPVQFCGGNFISGQKERRNLLSVLTTAEFGKDPATGEVACMGLSALPLVTHYVGDRTDVSIYPLDDYTEELANENGVKQFENEVMTMDYLWEQINAAVPEQYLAHTS